MRATENSGHPTKAVILLSMPMKKYGGASRHHNKSRTEGNETMTTAMYFVHALRSIMIWLPQSLTTTDPLAYL